jgi:hypothetical protein
MVDFLYLKPPHKSFYSKNSGIELLQVIQKNYVEFMNQIQEKNGKFLLNKFHKK